jgi:hypothetical protein
MIVQTTAQEPGRQTQDAGTRTSFRNPDAGGRVGDAAYYAYYAYYDYYDYDDYDDLLPGMMTMITVLMSPMLISTSRCRLDGGVRGNWLPRKSQACLRLSSQSWAIQGHC